MEAHHENQEPQQDSIHVHTENDATPPPRTARAPVKTVFSKAGKSFRTILKKQAEAHSGETVPSSSPSQDKEKSSAQIALNLPREPLGKAKYIRTMRKPSGSNNELTVLISLHCSDREAQEPTAKLQSHGRAASWNV